MNDNQLIKISNPFEPFLRECRPIPFVPGRTVAEMVELSGFGRSVVVLLNGRPVDDFRRVLLPGDIVHIYPQIHNDTAKTLGMIGLAVVAAYAIGPAVSGALGGGFLGGGRGCGCDSSNNHRWRYVD